MIACTMILSDAQFAAIRPLLYDVTVVGADIHPNVTTNPDQMAAVGQQLGLAAYEMSVARARQRK